MSESNQFQSDLPHTQVKKSPDIVPQTTEGRRESMKKMLESVVEARSHQSPVQAGAKEPVTRGDGTVLPERTEDQPINRMKRTLDTNAEKREAEL